jgi:hypothetical protein
MQTIGKVMNPLDASNWLDINRVLIQDARSDLKWCPNREYKTINLKKFFSV